MTHIRDFFTNNSKTISFILISVLLFSIYLVHSNDAFKREPEAYWSSYPVAMESDNPIRQEISIKEAEILSISIRFGTYERINEGTLVLTLYEDDNVIQQWTRDTAVLVDNDYSVFDLDSPYSTNPDHGYSFTIEDRYSGDNVILSPLEYHQFAFEHRRFARSVPMT